MGDEKGEKGEIIPARVRTQRHFYVYYRQYMAERVEHQASLASQAGSRDDFEDVMRRVREVMTLLDTDLLGSLPETVSGPRKRRFAPAYEASHRKRRKVHDHDAPTRCLNVHIFDVFAACMHGCVA